MRFLNGTVYSKALAIFLAASLVLLGTVAALTQLIIFREFSLNEQRELKALLQRLSAVMARETRPLENSVGEWAKSPQIGAYLAAKSPDGTLGRISPETLRELNIDFVGLYDEKGSLRNLVFVNDAMAGTLAGGEQVKDVLRQVMAKRWLEENKVGYGLINSQICLLAVCPVWTAHGDAPTGYLIAGKIVDQNTWGFLEGLFSATIKFQPFKSTAANEVAGRDIIDLLNSQEIVIETEDDSQITGYRLVKAIDGEPLGYISVSLPRPLRQQGLRAIQIFLTGICLAGGALVIVIWVMLDRTILARIKDLTRKLDAEKRLGRLPVRLNFKGDDELGTLARSIENLAGLLENTQSQYRAVVEDQTEMICRFDASLQLAFFNQVFARVLRLEENEPAACSLAAILPKDSADDIVARFERLTPGNSLITYTHDLVLNTGEHTWLRSTLRKSFSPAGVCTGGQWVAADISSQIEAQTKLLESERLFRRLFETASDGILLVDWKNLFISDINPSLCRMLMLAGSEVLGRALDQMDVFAPCLDIVNYYRRPAVDGGRRASFRNECRLERADGSGLYIELKCSSYEMAENRYIQLNFRNISERVLSERELRKLSAKLLRMQDDERRRIARELHDSTAQNLSALEMNMSLLEPLLGQGNSRAVHLVQETRQLAAECSRELRNISYLLHPPLIDEVGLSFAIKWFVDGFAKRTGIGATVEIEEGFPRLEADVEMPLFRIVQEAMTNVYRHSGADHAWVSLHCEGRFINLEVRDNGCGFGNEVVVDEDGAEIVREMRLGVGLAGMRERLANLGGKLDIESSPLGVTISVRLALNHFHAAENS